MALKAEYSAYLKKNKQTKEEEEEEGKRPSLLRNLFGQNINIDPSVSPRKCLLFKKKKEREKK